jgi:hypothetical protein
MEPKSNALREKGGARFAAQIAAGIFFTATIVCGTGIGAARAMERLVPSQYPTIQAAIDASVDGDVVIVADGLYTGTGNRDIDFLGKALTVRSENGPVNCIIDCQASWTAPHRGFRFHTFETTASVLDGFTIQNGYAPVEMTCNTTGGGILCRDNANPTIRNCIVRWCTAPDL